MKLADTILADTVIPTHEGYLLNSSDWTPAIAEELALENDIELTTAHWAIINAARNYYLDTSLSPAMRPLVKALQTINPDGNSITIKELFGENTAQMISLLSGLPKPLRCL